MKIGTHNSMTYLKPKKWFLYPFRFMAKCQSKNIVDLYFLGARMFDLRISFKNFIPEFRHGSMAFKGDVESILDILNCYGPVYVRLLLEVHKNTKDLSIQEDLFKLKCEEWERKYPNIKFFCGRRKFDWKQLYKFELDDVDIDQKVSSMIGTKIDDLWPWLYAKLFNKKNFKNRNKNKWLLLDFIEYVETISTY